MLIFEETLVPFINVEHTYYDVTIVVIAFITLGKYLEARSKIKTGDADHQIKRAEIKKMKIGIISSMAGSSWGGSEELWVALANKALSKGDEVAFSVFFWGKSPPKI